MKIRSPFLTKVVATLVVGLGKLLFWTCRKHHLGTTHRVQLNFVPNDDDPERYIMCVWHDVVLFPVFAKPAKLPACSLVSRHQDGSYLAAALEMLHFSTVRGSSHKGGVQAAKQLLTETNGKHICITPDGPQGPRHVMKSGALYVASQTGKKFLPSGFACSKGWRIPGKWTDLLIPCPFSTIYFVFGEPLAIPSDVSREELEAYRLRAEQALNDIQALAEHLAAGGTTSYVKEYSVVAPFSLVSETVIQRKAA